VENSCSRRGASKGAHGWGGSGKKPAERFASPAAGKFCGRHAAFDRPQGYRARGVDDAVNPSLRANGSRECAPDDMLREAIQNCFATEKTGLLRRSAPRNDEL